MRRLINSLLYRIHKIIDPPIVSLRYRRHVVRIREDVGKPKVRVLFIVSEIAKWKEQSLYEAMEKSGVFEPIVGLSAWNGQIEELCPNDKLAKLHERAAAFFAGLGDRCVNTVRIVDGKREISDLREFRPDIVYYTEPWSPAAGQDPRSVSRFALTCYSPYYVPNYSIIEQECKLDLHRWLWIYFCLGEWQAKHYANAYLPFARSTRFVGAGHPSLDPFYLSRDRKPVGNMVIYAPHCTIAGKGSTWPQHYATFRWSGSFMLEYAKAHPEIKWVFKPHPLLKRGIKMVGLMSDEAIEAYYSEWRAVAAVSEDSNYQDMFLDSRAMITDCGSFLSEYGATGRPVIHLISAENIRRPISKLASLYDTYYKVHDQAELKETLGQVVEAGLDPARAKRLEALKESGLGSVCASENIISHLRKVLNR